MAKREISPAEFLIPPKRPAVERAGPRDREHHINGLIEWVRSLEGGYLHQALKLKNVNSGGGLPDFTLVVDPNSRNAVHPGETLMRVPICATMSCLTLPENSGLENEPLRKALSLDLDSTAFTALLLMIEYNNPASRWRDYIESLPQPHCTESFDSAAWYEGEDLAWLKGTSVYAAREAQIDKWKGQWRQLYKSTSNEDVDEDRLEDSREWQLYKWAMAVISSRSFSSSILPKSLTGGFENSARDVFPVLIPLIDMLNHRPLSRVEWRPGGKDVGFAVMEEIRPGDEIFNNYGPKSNDQLLMGYGFCIPENPCDYYRVEIGAPSDSPLAFVRAQQQQLKDSHAVDSENHKSDVISKTVGSSYILNLSHPLRNEVYMEDSMFSEELLDNLSILSANKRELNYLTFTYNRCWINTDDGHHRNLLNTFCQMLSEIQVRTRLLKNTARSTQSVNLKQRNAKIYRDGVVEIMEVATIIITYCVFRSTTQYLQSSDQDEDLIDLLTELLAEQAASKARKVLLFERNRTRVGELFRSKDTFEFHSEGALNEVWGHIWGHRTGLMKDWSPNQWILARHTIFVCVTCTIFKCTSFPEEVPSKSTDEVTLRKLPERLESWMQWLLENYPEEQHHKAPEDTQDPDYDLETCLPHFLELIGCVHLLKVHDALAMDLWTRERLEWCLMVVLEEGVNVPALRPEHSEALKGAGGSIGSDMGEIESRLGAEAEYHLYIPQLPE